jgi:hypothetical protein
MPGPRLQRYVREHGIGLADWAGRRQADDTPRHRGTFVRELGPARERGIWRLGLDARLTNTGPFAPSKPSGVSEWCNRERLEADWSARRARASFVHFPSTMPTTMRPAVLLSQKDGRRRRRPKSPDTEFRSDRRGAKTPRRPVRNVAGHVPRRRSSSRDSPASWRQSRAGATEW